MAERTLRSGEVAAAADVNVETLRYYERRGLLKKPTRRPSGYRVYTMDTVRVIRFIKRAQELGFTLQECEELLVLRNDRSRACADVQAAALAKAADVEAKIRDLRRMKKALTTLAASCDDGERECAILEALDRGSKG